MDDKFKAILDTLEKTPPRSRLEPYGELIAELRRRRRTYRDIARILTENCNIKTSRSTVHDFVRSRLRNSSKPRKNDEKSSGGSQVIPTRANRGMSDPTASEMPLEPDLEARQRIAALKRRNSPAQERSNLFQFDPNEPLRLPSSTDKKRNGH